MMNKLQIYFLNLLKCMGKKQFFECVNSWTLINCVYGLNDLFSITNQIDIQNNMQINHYFIKLENHEYENCYLDIAKVQLPIFGERKI